jgi:DNA-binding CsgD family transcriptional regulator
MTTAAALDRARQYIRQRAWAKAYATLSRAEGNAPLGPADLERLAMAAYLTGRDAESHDAWARAHHDALAAGDLARSARCAFWLGFWLLMGGERTRGGAWVSRARRLVEDHTLDCVEAGYLMIPDALGSLKAGDHTHARVLCQQAGDIARRFGDTDLAAISCLGLGQSLISSGALQEGSAWLDEAMVAVEAGEVSPPVAGIVYCGVIETCQAIFDLRRAREWTAALTRWCESQPDLVPYRGRCLVHRAELMYLNGAWTNALDEARRACIQLVRRPGEAATGYAFYLCAEVHRMRGESTKAEDDYRQASQWGWTLQPGLALLRLSQGRLEVAGAAIQRLLHETTGSRHRAAILPAYVEIMLAAAKVEPACVAADELLEIAETLDAPQLHALASKARGSVLLANGEARAALLTLRQSWTLWEALEVPYESAHTRILIGLACRQIGDEDTAAMELDAARRALRKLGAPPALARLDALDSKPDSTGGNRLTPRQLQVLRLIATGKTNLAIANELGLSERTIDRHVSNILDKLDVPSRAAATARAYDQKLL